MPNLGIASSFLAFLVLVDFRFFRTDITHVRKVRNDRHAPEQLKEQKLTHEFVTKTIVRLINSYTC